MEVLTIETEKQSVVVPDEQNMGGAQYNVGPRTATCSPGSRRLAATIREDDSILLGTLRAAQIIAMGRKLAGRSLNKEEMACYQIFELLE